MLRNGLYYVAGEAAGSACEPLARKYRASVILGSLREDVIALPVAGFTEYPSFSHFGGCGLPGGFLPLLWPGPRSSVSRLYRRALGHAGRGRLAAAFVALGRAAHVLTDVCIPSHVHRAAHERDPFEWWIEGNLPELSRLEPQVAPPARAVELVQNLATRSAAFAPDRTNTPWGRALRRRGRLRGVPAAEARRQALELVPHAVSHVRALLEQACREVPWPGPARRVLLTSPAMSEEDEVLAETLEALDLPERMLRPWFDHNRAFCQKHGGRRVYGGLLELLDRCDQALERRQATQKGEK
ncbi:MAG TPA: hypothetical protein VHB79_00295 [Polyangiaceae bacterium]|nr:hypothetical protein [Polyangiaceae bacterium]